MPIVGNFTARGTMSDVTRKLCQIEQGEPSLLEPLRSTHTSTFPELLAHFGVSVLVTIIRQGG